MINNEKDVDKILVKNFKKDKIKGIFRGSLSKVTNSLTRFGPFPVSYKIFSKSSWPGESDYIILTDKHLIHVSTYDLSYIYQFIAILLSVVFLIKSHASFFYYFILVTLIILWNLLKSKGTKFYWYFNVSDIESINDKDRSVLIKGVLSWKYFIFTSKGNYSFYLGKDFDKFKTVFNK